MDQATTPLPGSADALMGRLRRFGITEWHEPLLCLPSGYSDYSRISSIRDALAQSDVVGQACILRLVVTEEPIIVPMPKRRMILTATDGMLTTKIVVFVVAACEVDRWLLLNEGDVIHVRGSVQNWNGSLQMVGPALLTEEVIGKVIPSYYRRKGVLADGVLFDATRVALKSYLVQTVQHIVDSFEGLDEVAILKNTRLKAPSIEKVLRAAHAPSSEDEGMRGLAALRRLAAYSIVANARRMKTRSPDKSSIVDIRPLLPALIQKLPFPLTDDQKTVLQEVADDLASPYPMRRVLSGDVGTGKTVCIMLPALGVQKLGKRAVILTPNSLLADQFVRECKLSYGENTNVVAVTGATKKVSLEGNPILVGTTALLSRLSGENAPCLLVVDEEQKLSVSQKQDLSGINTNYMQATATPIPRTTALISHGALDVSIIRQLPVQKTITSILVKADEGKRLFEHTRKILDAGGQVAIVYPLVDQDEQERKSVVAAYELWSRHFPGQVAMIHGQMKEQEKLDAINGLKAGQFKIGIGSSVLELGITLPSLRSLIVVNAERYGTSTLHQLRGRVARHGGKGFFFMYLPDPVGKDAMTRLQLLVDHSDGFVLSEKDADLRGYGDLFENAERQSGSSRSTVFRCVDLTPTDIHAASKLECSP